MLMLVFVFVRRVQMVRVLVVVASRGARGWQRDCFRAGTSSSRTPTAQVYSAMSSPNMNRPSNTTGPPPYASPHQPQWLVQSDTFPTDEHPGRLNGNHPFREGKIASKGKGTIVTGTEVPSRPSRQPMPPPPRPIPFSCVPSSHTAIATHFGSGSGLPRPRALACMSPNGPNRGAGDIQQSF